MKLTPLIFVLLLLFSGPVSSVAVPVHGGPDIHNSALQALQVGDVQTAVSLLSQAIKAEPDNYRYYNDRGVAYKRLGEYEKALSDYTKALEIQPNYTHALNNRGVLYLQQGNCDKAIQDFRSALKQEGLKGKLHTNLGIALARKGDYQSAIKEFESAVSFRPVDDRSFLFMAESLEKVGEKDKALKMYELAQGLATNSAIKGMVEKRMASLEKGLSVGKTVIASAAVRGRRVAVSSPRTKPVSNQAGAKQPDRTRQILLARPIHQAENKPMIKPAAAQDSGIDSLHALDSHCRDKALGKFSPASVGIYRQGIQFLERSEIRKALIRFEDVLQLETRNKNTYAIAWSNLETGRLYSKMGDYPTAAGFMEGALKLFKRLRATDETILSFLELGSNQRIAGNKEGAAALYSKAMEEAASKGLYKLAKAVSDLAEGREPQRVVQAAASSKDEKPVLQKMVAGVEQKVSPSNQAKVPQTSQQPTLARKEKAFPEKAKSSQVLNVPKMGRPAKNVRAPVIRGESGSKPKPVPTAVITVEKEAKASKSSRSLEAKPSPQGPIVSRKIAAAPEQHKLTESKARPDKVLPRQQSVPGVPAPKALAAVSRVPAVKPPLPERKTRGDKSIRQNLVELKKFKETDDEANMIVVLERLAHRYSGQKDYKKALAALTASLAFRQKMGMQKGMENALRQSGLLREKLGDKAGALEDLTRAAAQAAVNGASKADKALATRAKKLAASIGLDSEAALRAFRLLWKARLAEDSHGETEALYLIGKLYEEADKPSEALQYYERSSTSMLADKARLYEKIGKTSMAEQSYNEALERFKKLDYSRYLNLLQKMRAPKRLSRD